MKIEAEINRYVNHYTGKVGWWFDLGISVSTTEYHPDHKWLVHIGFGLFCIYIRLGKK
jgi:hypothetical protein